MIDHFTNLKDDKGKSVGMSTEDFAEYRTKIGSKNLLNMKDIL